MTAQIRITQASNGYAVLLYAANPDKREMKVFQTYGALELFLREFFGVKYE